MSDPTPQAVRRALARAEAGKAVSVDEVTALLATRGEQLEELLGLASRHREMGHGRSVTYSRKVFVPLTMLCRDHCHYCTFAKAPAKLDQAYLTPEEVVAVAEAGRQRGCKEALFTLGDRPEERYPVAREWLASRGYSSTLDYLRAVSIRVIEETGLLPHLNPGVMSWEDMARLKHVSASMGMMLETSSDRLSAKGGPHFGSPDKVPAVRLRTIEDAGRLSIPFTTGILVGIGETLRERAESLLAIRDLHRKYRHVQEVIVQNFVPKPGTAMHASPPPEADEYLATIATARVVFGPRMHLQAPPNLSDDRFPRLLDAGIDDWGGVSPLTPDHVNPEKPWPRIERLAEATASRGLELRERLTVYPEYALRPDPWISGKMQRPVAALVADDGRAREGQRPEPVEWQDPDVQWKPRQIALTFAKADGAGLREDSLQVYGDFDAFEVEATKRWASRARDPKRLAGDIRRALKKATAGRPDDITDGEAVALFEAEGEALEALCAVADDLRRDVAGDEVTYVVNRNINFTNVCYTGCRFCAFAQREVDHARLGISFREFLQECRDRGLGSIPGTAAEILDDDVRWVLTKGKLPADTWEEIVKTAHDVGLPSSSTMMYGHVDAPPHWVAHIRRLARIQDESGRFTEFVPLPFVHQNSPIYLAGKARPGPTHDDNRRVHAVARILLHGRIPNVQVSWVKMGIEACQLLLRGGANDLGGTLMEETISRMAGAEWGIRKEPEELEAAIRAIGRTPAERTTTYGRVHRDRPLVPSS